MPDEKRARYEAALGRAHRALWIAGCIAGEMGDHGAEEDLEQLLREVTRIAEGSLKGSARRAKSQQIAGQTSLTDSRHI